MKIQKIILILILIGIATLFFFPEPETNFIAYFGIAFFFVTIIVFLRILSKKRDNKKIKNSER